MFALQQRQLCACVSLYHECELCASLSGTSRRGVPRGNERVIVMPKHPRKRLPVSYGTYGGVPFGECATSKTDRPLLWPTSLWSRNHASVRLQASHPLLVTCVSVLSPPVTYASIRSSKPHVLESTFVYLVIKPAGDDITIQLLGAKAGSRSY